MNMCFAVISHNNPSLWMHASETSMPENNHPAGDSKRENIHDTI